MSVLCILWKCLLFVTKFREHSSIMQTHVIYWTPTVLLIFVASSDRNLSWGDCCMSLGWKEIGFVFIICIILRAESFDWFWAWKRLKSFTIFIEHIEILWKTMSWSLLGNAVMVEYPDLKPCWWLASCVPSLICSSRSFSSYNIAASVGRKIGIRPLGTYFLLAVVRILRNWCSAS